MEGSFALAGGIIVGIGLLARHQVIAPTTINAFAHVPMRGNYLQLLHVVMLVAGVIEIIAGIGVAIWPKVFSCVVALWLLGIIVNLLLIPASTQMPHYDIALRDFGLFLAALALARLSRVVDH